MKGLLVILSVLFFSFVPPAQAQWPLMRDGQESKSTDSGGALTSAGRFQVFTTPQAKNSTFMLDTESGKVWIMRKDPSSGDYSLHRIPVDDIDQKSKSTPEKNK